MKCPGWQTGRGWEALGRKPRDCAAPAHLARCANMCTARYIFVLRDVSLYREVVWIVPGRVLDTPHVSRFAVWVFAIRSLRRVRSPGQVRKYVYSQIHICTARYNFVPGGSMVSIQTRVGHTRFAVWVFAIRSLRRDRSAGQVRKYVYHEIEVRTRGF